MQTKEIIDQISALIDLVDPGKPQPIEERHVLECFEKLVALRHELHEELINE